MKKVKRILKIAGISIGSIVVLFIAIGLLARPQQKTDTPEQSVVATQNVVANDTTSTTIPEQLPSNTMPVANSTSTNINQSGLVRVVSVVDGDTIKVSLNGETQTVRLIGIDTPEVVDPRKPVQCFGEAASAKAKAILTGQMVRLESDPTQGDLDKYQRLLRYVYLSDGTFFNEMMIAEGYAHEYTYNTPYKYRTEFKAAQAAAQKAQLGLWSPSTCNGDTTTPAASSTTQTKPTQPAGHTFYLSTYFTSKYYYCDTDPGWQSLSPQYLKSYPSEQALLAEHPTHTLHAPCQ